MLYYGAVVVRLQTRIRALNVCKNQNKVALFKQLRLWLAKGKASVNFKMEELSLNNQKNLVLSMANRPP